jgi:sodium pump decarboxylase gamma subunit
MNLIPIGLQLTFYGMGIVFLLLAVMALLISLLLRLDRPSAAEPSSDETMAETATEPNYPDGLDASAIAAITVAVMQHRMIQRKQAAPTMRRHQPGTLPSRWVSIGRTNQTSSWQNNRRT